MRQFLRTAFFVAALAVWIPLGAAAQTSIGYSNPTDVDDLLGYRLPTWSYRVWDANFRLNGNGNDERYAGETKFSNNTSLRFGSDYSQAWESEQRYLSLSVRLDGNYRRSHNGSEDLERQIRDLGGQSSLSGTIQEYLGDSPFLVQLEGDAHHSYNERESAIRLGDEWDDTDSYARRRAHGTSGGIGWGRVRNVEPLLRAQRLSERLVALGRAPLTTGQIHEIATVWAQQSGYFNVYDRYGRHFWNDILAPMLVTGPALSAYEILYLMDVNRESLGQRREGLQVVADFAYEGAHHGGNTNDRNQRQRRVGFTVAKYHNLSLTQQISLSGSYGYRWENNNTTAYDGSDVDLELSHLWNLTDRYRLDTSFAYEGSARVQSEMRSQSGSLQSDFYVYLEDQLSLNLSARTSYRWNEHLEAEDLSWSWTYGVGLIYHLDRAIF